MYRIVFSDIDGTLLNDEHKVTKKTFEAIYTLNKKNIPFVIVSARSPSGIYPILKKNNFNCEIISYSGGYILDENRNVIYSKGFSLVLAKQIINFIETKQLDCTYNLYYGDHWVVKEKDERVLREENIVETKSIVKDINNIESHTINKILLMCNPNKILEIENLLKENFKDVVISKSSNILIEINALNVTKANAIKVLCDLKNININDAIAFGDNFNDKDMLLTVGHPFLMDNAPSEMKNIISNTTLSNNDDGIYYALKKLNII